MHHPFLRALGGLLFAFTIGCGSDVIQDQCDTTGCIDGEIEVEECSNDSCREVEICSGEILCEVPTSDCLAEPVCDLGDAEVPSCDGEGCYEVTTCGSTIFCAADCSALYDCDPGDAAVPSCPPDTTCYEVEVCGEITLCADDGLPVHGCPIGEPESGEPCNPAVAPAECTYPDGGGCFSSFSCAIGENGQAGWTFIGGGCDGG